MLNFGPSETDVMSDWSATHSTISAVRGLDVGLYYFCSTSRPLICSVDDDAWRYHIRLWDLIFWRESHSLRSKWDNCGS